MHEPDGGASAPVRQKRNLPAKVTRPLLARYHSRLRVFDLMDRCWEYPVIWVTGPAGSGKTTLVASYLKERRIRSVWYQVDESDADPATFFYYMRHAAKIIAPRRRACLPLLKPEYQMVLPHFSLRYFEQLFERMPEHSVIVLDNYQDVPDPSSFHSVIRQGLSTVPRGLHMVIISRNEPPSEMARLEANRQMATIGWNDLRLSPEETEGLVGLLVHEPLSHEKIEEFHNLAGGWAAGVVLMVQKARSEGLEPFAFSRKHPELIFDYFVSEVFDRMGPENREFLLKTAYLPFMDLALAEKLTGRGDAGRILEGLARHNYFVIRRFHRDMVFSYHPLFRQFLLDRSRNTFSREKIIENINTAACLLEENGQIDDALDLVRESGDWTTLSQFLMGHAQSLLAQGRHRSLERLLGGVPGDILNASPWLLLWLAVSRLPFDTVRSMGHFEAAYRRFRESGDHDGFFLAWSGMASAVAFAYTSGSSRVDALIKDMDERKETFDNLASKEIRARVAVGMFGILALQRPQHPDAGSWAELALDLARQSGNTDAMAQTMLSRLYYHWETGTLNELSEDIDSLRQLEAHNALSELARLSIKLGEAQFYSFTCRHDRCLNAVESGLELARVSSIHMWDTFLIGHAVMSCHNVCDREGAEAYINRLAPFSTDPRPWVQVNMLYVKTRHAMIMGNTEEAIRCMEKAIGLEVEPTVPATFCLHRVFYAQVMHCLGRSHDARRLMAQADSVAERIGSKHFGSLNLLYQAQVKLDNGRVEEGLEHLTKALPLAREWGAMGALWDIPSSTGALYVRALEAGIEREYVREIIQRRNLVPDETALLVKDWPWPVQIYTLGRFEVFRDGEPLKFSKKAQRKPMELLKAIIARGMMPASEGYVADLLWPDADGDMAMNSLATTLHRLRKLMGRPDAIIVKNAQISLDPRLCWVDSWAFEQVFSKAESQWGSAGTERAKGRLCELACASLEMYRGEFLPDEVWNPDAFTMREHLRGRYFQGLYRLGEHLARNARWEQALHLYEQGLNVDDCAEGCYQGVMRCLERMGRRSEALAVFERCRRTLDLRLGAVPSSQTQALSRSIRQGTEH